MSPRDLLNLGRLPAPAADDDFAPLPADLQAGIDRLYNGDAAQPPVGIIRSAIENRKSELFDNGVTADPTALGEMFERLHRETGLPDGLVRDLADHHVNNLLANARFEDDPEKAAQELEKRNEEWARESRERLRLTYGDKDVKDIVARTRKFVQSHPKLKDVLNERGLGSRPEVVTAIAAHVFSSGWR